MINIMLSGCGGYMGNVVTGLIENDSEMNITVGIDKFTTEGRKYPVYSSFSECRESADVIIDFSHPSVLNDMLEFAVSKKCALVLAVTGYTDEQNEKILMASSEIPIFQSGSMSMGINLMKTLIKKAASALGDDFDIEIIERHHSRKLDAPSGTALLLADALNETFEEKKEYNCTRCGKDAKRKKSEIGIHAVRGGTIVGEHEVIFAGLDEIIEIKHTSLSRNIFAAGAIRAAKFICAKEPGHYNMDDML
ncbi:MAG: 4-hydroxy-tetrahydrodipicolinate reductase [Clostridia bacterium]|nr:4-hydroxy-tetrahydrodipicolinate reductase [Clostridia bacterium]